MAMAQHGYLREYDEGSDLGDDRDNRRDNRRDSDGDRNFMLGERDAFRSRDQAPSHYGREHGYGGFQGDYSRSGREQGGFGGSADRGRSPRTFRSHQDDHYRSWRDRQIEALDRDYADYCREREQQFHQDFDTWRSLRRGNNPGPLVTGMTQTGQSHDPSGTLELINEATDNAEPNVDPMDSATLGTN
jgi:hypothetical protein